MKRLLCLLMSLAALAPVYAQEQPMRIACEMSVPSTLKSGQAAQLVFALTNSGTEVIQVLNWQTPFEGIKSEMFTVTRDGVEVEYHGPMLKRAAPRKEHYFTIKPGERKQATIDLAKGWEVEPPGKYVVEYSAHLFDVIAGLAAAPRSLDEANAVTPNCNSATFTRVR